MLLVLFPLLLTQTQKMKKNKKKYASAAPKTSVPAIWHPTGRATGKSSVRGQLAQRLRSTTERMGQDDAAEPTANQIKVCALRTESGMGLKDSLGFPCCHSPPNIIIWSFGGGEAQNRSAHTRGRQDTLIPSRNARQGGCCIARVCAEKRKKRRRMFGPWNRSLICCCAVRHFI